MREERYRKVDAHARHHQRVSSFLPFFVDLYLFSLSQVEGFPSPDEVRTFYVEHDIDGSEEDTSVLEFICTDKRILATKEEIIETLASVGFNDERQGQAIGSLSGGWKMKLALARAMLFRADILLLDEPTNHLDVVNVAWLENYLTNLKTCTSSMFLLLLCVKGY